MFITRTVVPTKKKTHRILDLYITFKNLILGTLLVLGVLTISVEIQQALLLKISLTFSIINFAIKD